MEWNKEWIIRNNDTKCRAGSRKRKHMRTSILATRCGIRATYSDQARTYANHEEATGAPETKAIELVISVFPIDLMDASVDKEHYDP